MLARMMTIAGALALGACGGLDWGGTAGGSGGSTGSGDTGDCMEGNNGCECKSDGSCNGDLICDADENTCRAMLEGHHVRCCYQGTWLNPSETQCGCQEINNVMCIDPNEWDMNNDGELSGSEIQAFCQTRCEPGNWPQNPLLKPAWNAYTCQTENPSSLPNASGQWFAGCTALNPDWSGGLPESKIEKKNVCVPVRDANDDNKYPDYNQSHGIDVDADFETSFSSGSSGNQLEIWVTGAELQPPSYDINVQYAINDCEPVGSEMHCTFVLTSFELTMPFIVLFEDWAIQDTALVLNQRVAADLVMVPGSSSGYWTGTFELSEANENAVGANLFWKQINREKETSIDNALHLGNTDDSLGGIEEIYGVIEVTPSSASTLRLIGYGADAISGGDWASVDFDLIGDLAPL